MFGDHTHYLALSRFGQPQLFLPYLLQAHSKMTHSAEFESWPKENTSKAMLTLVRVPA